MQTPAPKKVAGTSLDREYLTLGLRIIGEFGAIIAVPIVVLSMVGKRLDTAYSSAPMFMIAGFVIAFALSAYAINRKARRFAKEYQTIVDRDMKTAQKTTKDDSDMTR